MNRLRWLRFGVLLAFGVAVLATGVTSAGVAVDGSVGVVGRSLRHEPTPPIVDSVVPMDAVAERFARYAATTAHGWTGGDSTYSLPLSDGRTLWMFSDTFLGPLGIGGARPAGARMVNNTFVVQDGERLDTVHGGTANRPAAVLPPAGRDRWFWVADGVAAGSEVQVVFQEYRRAGAGVWDFAFNRNVLARFRASRLDVPVAVDPLPSTSGVAWGAAILPAARSGDGYTYIYGVFDRASGKRMRIARVRGGDLRRGPWWYRTADGWSTEETAAADITSGLANEYSVLAWNGHFLLITQDSTDTFSDRITASVAPHPDGPFRYRTTLYRTPETGMAGAERGQLVTYNAHAHPQLSTDGGIVVSYNVNSLGDAPDASAADAAIYRPRFIEVRLRR